MEKILSYFVRNPNAADTIEGVARERLLEETIHRNVQQTAAAMAWLVEQGFLEVVQIPGGRRIYRLNTSKQDDAVRFLGEHGE